MYEDGEYCYQQQHPLNACFSKAGQFLSCDIANIILHQIVTCLAC